MIPLNERVFIHLLSSWVWTTIEFDGWPSTVLKNGTKKKSYLVNFRRLANVYDFGSPLFIITVIMLYVCDPPDKSLNRT